MDISTITKSDSFKNFIIFLFPGYLAVWPYLYLFIKYENIAFDTFQIIIFVVITIIAAGIGTVIENIGSHLEVCIAKKFGVYKEMEIYWIKYLLLKPQTGKEDFIYLIYISTLVISLKVELSLMIAVPIMIIGQIWIQISIYGLFTPCAFAIYIVGVILFLIYLYFETKHTIGILHKSRKNIIDHIENTKLMDSEENNGNFE